MPLTGDCEMSDGLQILQNLPTFQKERLVWAGRDTEMQSTDGEELLLEQDQQ